MALRGMETVPNRLAYVRILPGLVTYPMHCSFRFLTRAILSGTASLLMPAIAFAQTKPPVKPPVRDTSAAGRTQEAVSAAVRAANARDSLTPAQRQELNRVAREARELSRERERADTSGRRALARAAEPTAFADSGAKLLLERARFAREAQDSALRSYVAIATQRISAHMGVRKIGLEKLMFRGDNVARISWKRGTGVWVAPVGSRMVVPMADKVEGDGFTSAITIPYFPGKETLWLPDGGVAKTDINEKDIIHPIARGAEAYYRYATGDSLSIKLADGKVIRIRELKVTARKPDWHLFVGSFWFDVDGGQLVRAAYRLAVDIDIWAAATEDNASGEEQNQRRMEILDSLLRTGGDTVLYKRDSTRRAEEARRRGNKNDDDVPLLVKATFQPAKAKLDGITVEYGLYQGKFWLPKANSAMMSAQVGFMRMPVTIDEKFEYESVDGDLSLPTIPLTLAQEIKRDSLLPKAQRDSAAAHAMYGTNQSNAEVCVGGCKTASPANKDSIDAAMRARALVRRDSSLQRAKTYTDSVRAFAVYNSRRDVQCQKDSTWMRTETRYDGALRMAYQMPCDEKKLSTAKELPAAYASDEELFDIKSRDDLLASLDMSLQPAWAPQFPKIRSGLDLFRYNRVEGLSVGVEATQTLGAGYTLRALGRIGHADLHANAELTAERSNGRRTAFAGVFHRLSAVNPEWGGALSLGPSLPAFLYTRDEGYYYRNFGFEFGERTEQRRGALEWRLFVERQYTAGDSDVVNTFSFGGLVSDRKFRPNIQSEKSSLVGLAGSWQQAYGNNPTGFRLLTTARGEMATGTRQYARLSLEGAVTRPVKKAIVSLTTSAGFSAGEVPAQRLWYMGGLKSVRGQSLGTQEGDAFWLIRSEIGRRNGFFRPIAFFDAGTSGSRKKFGDAFTQRGAGVGFSLLDGLIRMDISRGLFPQKRWRTDLYLEAPI
ncbi:MAG: hypothetical protein ABJB74_19660 [Gemmatimonas sp.]